MRTPMLTKDEIQSLNIVSLEDGSPPPEKSFDDTSYNLRLGKQYCLIFGSDNMHHPGDCSEGMGLMRIPPFACALVSSEEIVKLPEIGRAVQQECRDRSRMPSSA
eukprot:TRINITY_DN98510_c0_g1_i1.p1 TRINITY_DN98510_c0_g1~~TRINITY_DN98510_c0_g1_i1.p1  ORF type:complete len:105 (-),score=13.43 TRINITY_DN98510_c0_g1_i1:10-324(-)